MKICDKWHDEIVFDGMACPLCNEKKEGDEAINDLKQEIASLNKEIDSLSRELEEKAS